MNCELLVAVLNKIQNEGGSQMKNRVVKVLLTFAVCGTLAGVVSPSVA